MFGFRLAYPVDIFAKKNDADCYISGYGLAYGIITWKN